MKRVALVTYALAGGGMETMLLRLGRGLQAAGWEPEIVTTVEPGAWAPRAAQAGLTLHHVPGRDTSLLGGLAHARKVGAFLRERAYRAVLLNHAKYAQASLAMLPGDVLAAPVLHNDDEDIYRVGLANPEAWNVAIAVSGRVAEEARRRLPGREIRAVANGVEVPDEPPVRERSETLRVVFAGRLAHAQKGVLLLPEIVRLAGDVHLDVLGDGPDRGALEKALVAAGVSDRVTLHGMVAPEEALAAFARADALLMPSFFEGLPVTLLEAMAAGCVPVVSRLPGITDAVVEEGVSGRFAPVGQASEFAARLVELAADPERRRQLSLAARERIRQSFSVDAMVGGYLEVLGEGLAGRLPTPRARHELPSLDPAPLHAGDFVPGPVRSLAKRLLGR